jgi:hypothetical protein
MPTLLLHWILWGMGQVFLTLVLTSIAPIFINSNAPILGLLIWISIVCLWLGSLLYVSTTLWRAKQVQRRFIHHFPQEPDYSIWEFVGLNWVKVDQRLEAWERLKEDEAFSDLNLSPLMFIQSKIKDW